MRLIPQVQALRNIHALDSSFRMWTIYILLCLVLDPEFCSRAEKNSSNRVYTDRDSSSRFLTEPMDWARTPMVPFPHF